MSKIASITNSEVDNEAQRTRILVIGGDHANTLASVRALSRESIAFDLVIHGVQSDAKTMVGSSRFAPSPTFVNESYNAVRDSIEEWIGDTEPASCVLLPSSDLAAFVIDEVFTQRGVLAGGFEGEPQRICNLMDKNVQAQWAAKCGIPVALGVELDLRRPIVDCPIGFPVVIKPVASMEGKKSDIAICRNQEEYSRAVRLYIGAGYRRAFVQEFVDYEYEITCIGVILPDGELIWRSYKKEIVYPVGRGSTACGRLETSPSVLDGISVVLRILADEGYRGLFDIDFFKTSERVMLNEINFRQSGIVSFPFCEGLFLPSLWAGALLGRSWSSVSADDCLESVKPYRAITEDGYLYYVKAMNESLLEWCKALKWPGSLRFPSDNGPFWRFVRKTMSNQLKKLTGKYKG